MKNNCRDKDTGDMEFVSIRCRRHKRRYDVPKDWAETVSDWLCPHCYEKLTPEERAKYAPVGKYDVRGPEGKRVRVPSEYGAPVKVEKIPSEGSPAPMPCSAPAGEKEDVKSAEEAIAPSPKGEPLRREEVKPVSVAPSGDAVPPRKKGNFFAKKLAALFKKQVVEEPPKPGHVKLDCIYCNAKVEVPLSRAFADPDFCDDCVRKLFKAERRRFQSFYISQYPEKYAERQRKLQELIARENGKTATPAETKAAETPRRPPEQEKAQPKPAREAKQTKKKTGAVSLIKALFETPN